MLSRTSCHYEEKHQVNASTVGDDHGACRLADVGWFLFEMNIEYDYLYYDNEFDEIHVAHPGGLLILGPGEGITEITKSSLC